MLLELGAHHQLKRFELKIQDYTDFEMPNLDFVGYHHSLFRSLEVLIFEWSGQPDCAQPLLVPLLRSIASTTLRRITVQQVRVTEQGLVDILSTLNRHSTLNAIALDTTLEGHRVPVTFNTLSLLHNLSSLRSLELGYIAVSLLSRDIERMGAMWPSLERLTLWPQGDYNQLLLNDLVFFAVHLPHLTELKVPFNSVDGWTQSVDLPTLNIDTAPRNPVMTRLSIVSSKLGRRKVTTNLIERIVALLRAVYPNAELDLDDLQEDAGAQLHMWLAVQNALQGR